MNDFLQTLRASQSERQRTPMTRRAYDEQFYNSNSRYPYTAHPLSSPQPPGQDLMEETAGKGVLFQSLERLNDQVQMLSENQRYLVDAQERAADMLERQVSALERLLSCFEVK